MCDTHYDVFLSYARRDRKTVIEFARRLKAIGVRPFLDVWELVPGESWQEGLEKGLEQSATLAAFLGRGEIGPWQNEEIRSALDARSKDDHYRVIPVLLPGTTLPEDSVIPRLLLRLGWVDFRAGTQDPYQFHRLLCGIRGVSPGDEIGKRTADERGAIIPA